MVFEPIIGLRLRVVKHVTTRALRDPNRKRLHCNSNCCSVLGSTNLSPQRPLCCTYDVVD